MENLKKKEKGTDIYSEGQEHPISSCIKFQVMPSRWVNGRISIEEQSYEVIMLLMNADPTIDSMRKHNLNIDTRRDGMFLASYKLRIFTSYKLRVY
jgi:hypothetical protein